MPEPVIVRATGMVRLVGSMPFYEMIISGGQGDWYIAQEDRDLLHDLQHRIVTVEGEETVSVLRSNHGDFEITRRELRNIRIIWVNGEVEWP